MSKVTIRDVAREAGVSVATVSYVINERTDKHISEETRKKVLQIANLLDYTPNASAKALATRHHDGLAALYVNPDSETLQRSEQMHVLDTLSSYLHLHGYDLIYLNQSYSEKYDKADLIICYDISTEYFHRIGDRNFCPLLALDTFVNDPLFFEICTDYNRLSKEAASYFNEKPYTYITLETVNTDKKADCSAYFSDIRYIRNLSDLIILKEELKSSNCKSILLTDYTLYQILSDNDNLDICFMPSLSEKKLDCLQSCIHDALSHKKENKHIFRI